MAQDYWWVTRPKRRLNSIPEELAAFCSVALGKPWHCNRPVHIEFEQELEASGTKRVGERRDASGSGGRTHAIMLYSLGLWFEKYDKVFLTLAGQAIMDGKDCVAVLANQVLRFQYPSAYSETVRINERFSLRPFIFLLRLLADEKVRYLTQEEIAFIVAIYAEDESNECYYSVREKILAARALGVCDISDGELSSHSASKNNLLDVANTIMNWLDFTRLVYREQKIVGIATEKIDEVRQLLIEPPQPIKYDGEADVFQRKYGIDPWHKKDTRNLLNSATISSVAIERNRILRSFFNYSSTYPVSMVNQEIVEYISNVSGTTPRLTECVLRETYPHGAIGGYMTTYRDMAFKGRDSATDFEIATTHLFEDVFGYDAIHLGQTGAKSAPDVLLVSEKGQYQAIIDNKAYACYSITGDHHNRMVYNYIANLKKYSDCNLPLGFFTYISGGFCKGIDSQIMSEVKESKTPGSCIAVATLIKLVERQQVRPLSHLELRELFGLNREILLSDIC